MASGRAGLTSPGLRLPYNPNLAVAPTAFLLQGPRHLLGPTSASTSTTLSVVLLPPPDTHPPTSSNTAGPGSQTSVPQDGLDPPPETAYWGAGVLGKREAPRVTAAPGPIGD